ncbi:DUF6241 domain-containing protein [Metaplanococcus flavidus]|uniref:DUF6241 domain-containing protein n=1 Tax=Metaplanococcus flavidus TaxID=569883 RepID=A0ABW3L9W9_9BACL
MKTILTTITISILTLAVIAGAGYWFIQDFTSNDAEEISAVADQIEERKLSDDTVEASDSEGTADKPVEDMPEGKLQTYLHQMTHQKIVAAKKIGAVEMTDENIENMLRIVRGNKEFYEHSEFYEETLVAWEKGDFSNAVSAHNTIWNWHGGTVGRATGLMSAEQEQAFVEKNFR